MARPSPHRADSYRTRLVHSIFSSFCEQCDSFCTTCDKPQPVLTPSPSLVPTTSPPPPKSTPSQPQPEGGLSNGAIAGIAAAGAVAILGLLLLSWLMCKRYHARGAAGGKDVKEMASKHHPNLVRLLGFCVHYDSSTGQIEQVLVYEFMANRDLESWIGAGNAVHVSGTSQISLKQWISQFVESVAVAVFKDPYLDAPDDLVLRWARLALSCTTMPAASRPSMNQVLGELVKLKEEAIGAHESHVGEAKSRTDMELGSSIGSSSFTAEMARAEREGMPSVSST
ncbi:unnamed protein product [Closterium sp. NIES-64]|nr:unnamed protein product [Closterium sp. NIES-64]